MAKYNGKDFVYTPGKFPAEQIELFDLSDLAYAICYELIRRGCKAEITIEYPKHSAEVLTMGEKNVSSLELLNDTAKHIYGKHYIELSDYETESVNLRISQVFREHRGEKISYGKWFEYLDTQAKLRCL